MRWKNAKVLFCLWILFVVPVSTELITGGLAVGVSLAAGVMYSGYEYVKCKWYECCDEKWILNDVNGLKETLKRRLYGQHLVQETVVRAIKAHTSNKEPSKALVMSFHGWTGGGKNYVSNIIAQSLYKKGLQSQYVHAFIAGLHFPHASEIDRYKSQLHQWIRGNVSRCGRSLFIFDELDKMDMGILDAIKPFIEYHSHVDQVDYRKSIFIFISNTAGNDITVKTLDNWKKGHLREALTLTEMEKVIHLAAYNEPGGLKFSQLISSHVIDHFIPFLPLEREHIHQCIRDHFRWKGVPEPSEERVRRVADMLQYFPTGQEIFSSSGCKRVAQKVNLLLEEEEENEPANAISKTDDL